MTRDNSGAFQPMIADASAGLGGVDANVGLNAASGNLNAAANMNPLGQATPWLNQSGQTSASQVGQYFSPYQDQVVDRIGELGARTLEEKLIPAIGDNFKRAGQFGSARMQEATGRALRDTNESVLAQQGQLMNQGYQQAQQAAGQDLSRFGQIGQTVGTLAGNQQQTQAQIGQMQGNLMNTGTSNFINANQNLGSLAGQGQSMALKDAAALQAVGQERQGLDQRNLDLAYSDFQNQVNYPKEQIGWLSNIIRGFQMPTSTSTASTGPANAYGPSGLASIASGLGGIAAFLKKDGGSVTKKEHMRQLKKRGALDLAGC